MSNIVDERLDLVPTTSSDEPQPAKDVNGVASKSSRFDPNFTDNVIKATGPGATPRMRKVMASLTRHLHDFCRENEITIDEFMLGIDMVSQ